MSQDSKKVKKIIGDIESIKTIEEYAQQLGPRSAVYVVKPK
jgi:hypothetical protein